MYNPILGFDGDFISNILPKIYRMPKWYAWIKGLISQGHRTNENINVYVSGSAALRYDALTTYNIDDEIIYNYKVFKSLINSNLGNTPDSNLDKWELISPSFIGLEERTRFTGQKIILEYALNRYFEDEIDLEGLVGFKQPDDPENPTSSDIFISTTPFVYNSFIVGKVDSESDYILPYAWGKDVFDVEILTPSVAFLFNINIPTGVYTRIGVNAEQVVRNFVDKYIPVGINYDIITY